MNRPVHRSSQRLGRPASLCAALVVFALVGAACSSDKKTATTTPVAGTSAATTPPTGAATVLADTTPIQAASPSQAFPDLAPPTGNQMVLGLVNSEGTPGLSFPEMRLDIQGAVDYLNQHGGMGGRPIKLETCTVKGDPNTSQACAQELVGKKVEMVLLGLDLFPDYATYTAAKIPVVGVLPILPPDYTANALFLTGGNATTMSAAAAVAKNHYKAKTVGIVVASNAGAASTEASLTAALDKAGIAHKTVKGGDNETDAGYQGLMRQAAADKPDLLVSLYSDAGCIGTIKGRAALKITIPVLTTGICSGKDVMEQVGDDALGWTFIGVQTQKDTPELKILQNILAPVLKVAPDKIDSTALGLGALGLIELMSLAEYADIMHTKGDAVTGASLYAFLGTATDLTLWPGGAAIACGKSAKYPTICSFTFPFAEYTKGGKVLTVDGLEAVSSLDYLP